MSMISEQIKEIKACAYAYETNGDAIYGTASILYQADDTIEALSAKLQAENRNFTEYKNLEEQGKLLKLPCAVGDTVYRINKGKKEAIIPMRVIGIAIRSENEFVMQTKDIAADNYDIYPKTSIGKTVFLTEEEAREALERLEGK